MIPVMSPIRITAAGERIVEPIIALAHCSKLARIIVTGTNSAEAVIDLHRLGYARATTTSNCGLPAGQYDVVLLDGRQRSIKAIETTLDWAAEFANGSCSSCVLPSPAIRRTKRLRFPWPMKSTHSGTSGGHPHRVSFAGRAMKSARRSPRLTIRSE